MAQLPAQLRNTAVSLALSAGLGLGVAALPTMLQPAPAQAYVSQLAVSLDSGASTSYRTIVRRAEQVARAAAQRSFDNDILVTEVNVTVTGSNGGIEMPVLSLNVSRNQWRGQPNPKRWATYYPMSENLLFGQSQR